MPGDAWIPRPTYVTTRAVTIQAPMGAIWPWLVQMGETPRGGFYSYVWVERLLGMHVVNADCLLPAWQQVQVGEVLDRAGTMRVKAVEPGRFLILGPPDNQ